jgi:hypothetical protein
LNISQHGSIDYGIDFVLRIVENSMQILNYEQLFPLPFAAQGLQGVASLVF